MAIAAAAFCLLCASVAHAQTPTTPTVSTIAVTSNPGTDNTYATGDKIEVTVTFSEAVTVSTTDGTPRLGIDIGGQPRNILYDRAGSSTGQLIFGYTVFTGDMDANGIAVKADGLALNGGTIQEHGRLHGCRPGHQRPDLCNPQGGHGGDAGQQHRAGGRNGHDHHQRDGERGGNVPYTG